ncbi:MAG TPA: hypothetical protein VL728_07140, partial [Cyclobacteriaceae bacterium]|nr:hypothetical protein [Cyclobacteriaceae bacterium]
ERALLTTHFIKMGLLFIKNGISGASQTTFQILWITHNSLVMSKKINRAWRAVTSWFCIGRQRHQERFSK